MNSGIHVHRHLIHLRLRCIFCGVYEVDCVPQNTPTLPNVPRKSAECTDSPRMCIREYTGKKRLSQKCTLNEVVVDSTRDALVVELQAKRTKEGTQSNFNGKVQADYQWITNLQTQSVNIHILRLDYLDL